MKNAERIYLITYGLSSKCEFVPESQVQLFLRDLGAEGPCSLVTPTDLTTADVDVWQRSADIVKRLERDAEETRLTLAGQLTKKRGA